MGEVVLIVFGKLLVKIDKGSEDVIGKLIVLVIGVCVCNLLGFEVDGDLVWNYKYVL